jgi:hypothetical protein
MPKVVAPQITVLLGKQPAPAKLNTVYVSEPSTSLLFREAAISTVLMVS